MNLARDNAICGEKESHIFRFEEKPTTVVRISPYDNGPLVWNLDGEAQWNEWFKTEHPKLDGSSSGLVLIFAKRPGERVFPPVQKVASDTWLRDISLAKLKAQSATLTEKSMLSTSSSTSGRRNLRTLPFSRELFRIISRKFYVHSRIARDISRADIPSFSAVDVEMGEEYGPTAPAIGDSNAWDMDLALSTTYFPHLNLTFAIMYGCTISVEKEVLQRLGKAMPEACHPLLMPGIFVELERSRHVLKIEATIDELETRIHELDLESTDVEYLPPDEQANQKQAKRSAWLDTTYLRNQLVSWNTQLVKMFRHADELNRTIFRVPRTNPCPLREAAKIAWEPLENLDNECLSPRRTSRITSSPFDTSEVPSSCNFEELDEKGTEIPEDGMRIPQQRSPFPQERFSGQGNGRLEEQMRRTGSRIKDRVQDIIDEYNEKIRDCTMRVDGMAMSTQWAQGEISVEIALATSRDSQHMRSIALVTMIFLPGTFFASIFSMTFFDWGDSDKGAVVSKYFWIYVVMAISFTLLTVGCWWYFGARRHSRRRKSRSDEEAAHLEITA
ncbi:Fc.00g010210.m01.CDS01 [Cosmosporella sp. VM-42]